MRTMTREEAERIINRGSRILFEYCRDNDIHYLVTGSSGGLDSAVTLGFAQRACTIARLKGYQLTSVGLVLPCFSKPDATRLGRLAAKTFDAWLHEMELSEIYHLIEKQKLFASDMHLKELLEEVGDHRGLANWDKGKKTAQGNLKARLRMALGTYYTANRLGSGMVLATGNLSETLMGFWTICGDVGDFNLIGNIFKGSELYDIAEVIGVPQEIIDAKPDADLGDGNDEEQLGAPYSVIDLVMIQLIKAGFYPNGEKDQLDQMYPMDSESRLPKQIARRSLNTAFKRRGPRVLTREELGLPAIKDLRIN